MNHLAVAVGVGTGCATAATGSAMPLNMAPAAPLFATSYDFDLLDGVLRGEKCVARDELETQAFWTATYNIDKFAVDSLTRAAIAAAAYQAVTNLDATIDAFIVTRVVATPRGKDVTCAKVSGRGVRLKKFVPPTDSASHAPPVVHEHPDDLVK